MRPQIRWMREHGTLHVPDVHAQNDFPRFGTESGCSHISWGPLRQQGEFIGVLGARRTEVRPFTPAQIKLLKPSPTRRSSRSRTCGCSRTQRSRWSSKRRRVKSWASSPARRRIFSRCWMRLPKMQRDLCDASDARHLARRRRLLFGWRRSTGRCQLLGARTRLIDRGIVSGRAMIDRQTIHFHDLAAEPQTEFPGALGSTEQAFGPCLRRRCCAKAIAIGAIHDSPNGGPAVHGKTDRAAQDLCRPSRDRHRERALVQRDSGAQRGIARSAGASDGNGRGARHHQPLADGRAAGARRHRRERGAGLRD